MLRLAFTSLSVLLLTGTSWAMPILKADVMVSAPVVTVGDMFDDAGQIADLALFRAPSPGTTGSVTLAEVRSALARVGITEFSDNGLNGTRVTRAAALITEPELAALISADLTNRGIITQGMSAHTLFSSPIIPISAEAVTTPVSIVNLRYLPATGAFTARFVIAGHDKPLDVAGSIELMVDAPHIRGNLPGGALLTSDNVEMRPVPLRHVEASGVVNLDDVIGKALARQSRDGMMLRAADLTLPQTVAKNDLVTIYFRKGPMTLTVRGQAVTGGATGSPVQILNLMSKRVISATVIGTGAVEVDAAPLAIAGL